AGLLEFYNMCGMKNINAAKYWSVIITCLLLLDIYFISNSKDFMSYEGLTPAIITLFITGVMLLTLLKRNIESSLIDVSVTLFGLFYVVWTSLHLILLRELKPFGFELTMSVIIMTWCADTGAYFIGGRFGKGRLHRVSPSKTKIGAAAAVIVSVICAFVVKYVYKLYFIGNIETFILGFGVGVMAITGDLSESLIKRCLEKKDSGVFMPGHGGVLDRIDSLMFSVPFTYYFIKWFMR
ncbi:phosphatidate cytidylyltransferase, partial [Elusimicrobiota bacterium]